jgi:two-component system chemotaxis response regulator CheY
MAKHILIVDDSKTVRNLVAFIMKKEGFKVTAAEDGLDGLEKLYSMEKVDLIISDVNMPRMDGSPSSRPCASRRRTATCPS